MVFSNVQSFISLALPSRTLSDTLSVALSLSLSVHIRDVSKPHDGILEMYFSKLQADLS